MGGLARAEDVAAPTMTRIVDGLVRLGLVVKVEHPDSARQVLITPTDSGTELMHTAAQRRVDVIVAALRSLPADERRLVVDSAPSLRELSSAVPSFASRLAEKDPD